MQDITTRAPFEVAIGSRDADPEGFARDFDASFERHGWAVVPDHGVDSALVTRASAMFDAFCCEPASYKCRFHHPRSVTGDGYTRCDLSHEPSRDDFGDRWQVGRTLAQGEADPAIASGVVWPEQPGGFREALSELFLELDRAGTTLLSAIARFLWLKDDWFVDPVARNDNVLQLIRLPPSSARADRKPFGFDRNVDLITMTLCPGGAEFELLGRDDRWIPVKLSPGKMLVAVGDMLQRITNDVLPSSIFRLSRAGPEPDLPSVHLVHFSVPFRSDHQIQTLPECGLGTARDQYPVPIAAGEYRRQRLREAGRASL
ncbi:MAG TPA: 2-oxoglutarate and iron-dependent oxygenase domain-containing protein [Allosphingosinicella sp.]